MDGLTWGRFSVILLRQYLIITVFKFLRKWCLKKLNFECNPWWIAEKFNEFEVLFSTEVGNE